MRYTFEAEKARLIPVANQPELKLTSAALSTIKSVREFSEAVLKPLGAPMGKRTKVECYLEPVFNVGREPSKDRPDGLIVVTNGKKTWTALVESKVKNAVLDSEQVKRYLNLAKGGGIDAVVTFSNQCAVSPAHSPVSDIKSKPKGVGLFHYSWSALQAEAKVHLGRGAVDDEDQVYILEEFCRFADHSTSGVNRFSRMSSEWAEAYKDIIRLGSLSKNSPLTMPLINDWNELTRSFCLSLSETLNTNVSMVFSRAEKDSPDKKIANDVDMLVKENKLQSIIRVPNAASDIAVTACMSTRHLVASMTLKAPADKKQAKSSISWVLRQLSNVTNPTIELIVNWPGRTGATYMPVKEALEDAYPLYGNRPQMLPSSFNVRLNLDMAGRFTQRNNFPQDVASAVHTFYTEAGQSLSAWQPKAPQVKKPNESSPPVLGENMESSAPDD